MNEINSHSLSTKVQCKYSNNKLNNKGLFKIQSANKWIEQSKIRPIPKMLFSEFWFENELCILFADTNLGKSILAVQIANSISSGVAIPGFKLGSQKQTILYFDFELSDKQFENRYSKDYKKHYKFNDDFIRIEINPEAEIPNKQSFEAYLIDSIELAIRQTGANILIIDNLTYLNNETETSKNALPLMKQLKSLKSKYNLSILVLAHTPKRDLSKAITKNDLAGSKMLINFCDSSFTIGESQKDKNIRYLKQIKVRQTEFRFDTNNVCICEIKKPTNFLSFNFIGFGTEQEHLKQIVNTDRAKRINEAITLKNEGLSNTEIGKRLCVSEGAIRKWCKNVPKIDKKLPF